MFSSVSFSHLHFAWPDGGVVFDDVSGAFNPGRTGLVGANGCGKSTLLRLIAGQLRPSGGSLVVGGEVAYLPQTITSGTTDTVSDLLGVRRQLDALHAIEQGSTDHVHYETLGDAWDVEARVEETLHDVRRAGGALASLDAGRLVATLSGGEAMALAVAGCRLRRAPVTLLDEPTNNLDAGLRAVVLDWIAAWPGTLIVVSHDAGLLESMDFTAELFGGDLTVFGGPYSQWRLARDDEQAAAEQAVKAARQDVIVAKRQRAATLERTTRSLARGKQKALGEGLGKQARYHRQGGAEASAGRTRGVADDRLVAAQSALAEAAERVRPDEHISIALPDPGVHASLRIAEFAWGSGSYIIVGRERVALAGRNGVGKTTLIETMLGLRGSDVLGASGAAAELGVRGTLAGVRVGYLPQRLDTLDESDSALDNVLAAAPTATPATVRAGLARMLIRGDAVFRPVRDLSGGERFRVALARLLLAEPPPQLLILDEPTNNLDLTSVNQLVEALGQYRGAILVVSHDADFLHRLGATVTLQLWFGDRETTMSVIR